MCGGGKGVVMERDWVLEMALAMGVGLFVECGWLGLNVFEWVSIFVFNCCKKVVQ